MNIYDSIIKGIEEKAGSGDPKRYSYDPRDSWKTTERYELILQKETAFELGGSGKAGVNFTCVTTDPAFFQGDEILVYGKELSELKESTAYARITLLLTEELSGIGKDSEGLYRAVQSMDFVKYHVFPKGYMMRTSSHNNREQVRISRKALKAGLSFKHIGNIFVRNYKKNKLVKNVKVIFITAPDGDFQGLSRDAEKVSEITASLSKILDGMPADCASCGLKDICDEVEELRELHFGRKQD